MESICKRPEKVLPENRGAIRVDISNPIFPLFFPPISTLLVSANNLIFKLDLGLIPQMGRIVSNRKLIPGGGLASFSSVWKSQNKIKNIFLFLLVRCLLRHKIVGGYLRTIEIGRYKFQKRVERIIF